MRFQVLELIMNLMPSPINGNFTKIFNQLDTLVDRVGKLEEEISHIKRHVSTGMEENRGEPNKK